MFDNEDADQLSSHESRLYIFLQVTINITTLRLASPHPPAPRTVDRDLSCEMRRQFRTLKAAL